MKDAQQTITVVVWSDAQCHIMNRAGSSLHGGNLTDGSVIRKENNAVATDKICADTGR